MQEPFDGLSDCCAPLLTGNPPPALLICLYRVPCRQRKYADAARVKALADELERRERKKLDDERLTLAAAREAKYRQQQAGELAALLKRIEARRAEHVKQREVDSKRLLQRNRNVLAVLDQRHVLEEQRFTASVKASLHPLRTLSPGHKGGGGGSGYGAARTPGGGAASGGGSSGDVATLNAAMEAFSMSSPSGAAGRPPTQTTVGAAGGLSVAGSSRPSTRGYSAAGPGSAGRVATADHGLISKRLGLGSPTGAAGGSGSAAGSVGSPGARARAGAAAASGSVRR